MEKVGMGVGEVAIGTSGATWRQLEDVCFFLFAFCFFACLSFVDYFLCDSSVFLIIYFFFLIFVCPSRYSLSLFGDCSSSSGGSSI